MAATVDNAVADQQHTITDLQRRLDEVIAERDEGEAQRAAMADVMAVINASPGDLAPVFDAILEKAHRPRVSENDMQRRTFIALLTGAAVAAPHAARSQQQARLPIVGFLGTSTPFAWGDNVTAFVERLHELGWIENRTMTLEYRWAEGRGERFTEIAAEFAAMKVDVVLTSGAAADAAKRVTSVIPIVFAVANDPLGTGLVASLAHPGGNITGLSNQSSEADAKRLELLREAVPELRTLAIMADVGYPAAALEMNEVKAMAATLGLAPIMLEIRRAEDIAPGFAALKDGPQALYVVSGPLVATNQVLINNSALGARLPTMHGVRDYVKAGGLIAYGPSYPHMFRRAADFVDKILRGAKPADLPVEQPTKFELVINLQTAKALDLTVPASLLARADEVIE